MALGMMSLLAGLANGYNEGSQQKLDNERRAKLDQMALDRATREGTEFDQAQTDRTALRAAGAPVTATPDMAQTPDGPMQRMAQPEGADNRDVGEAGAMPTQPAMRVGMQGMLSPDQAKPALAALNTPEAAAARQQAELQRQNPQAGMKMAAEQADAKLKDVQLRKAVTLAKDEGVSRSLSMALAGASADEVMKAFGESGQQGMTDLKIEPFENTHPDLGKGGTARMTGKMADGTPFNIPDARAFQFALMSAEKQIAIKDKMADNEQQKLRYEQLGRYQDGQLEIGRQGANTTEQWRRDQAEIGKTRAANVGSGRRADHFDEKEWDAVNKIEPSYVSFSNADSGKPEESADLRNVYRSEIARARSAGDQSPNDAAESARTATLMLKNAASAKVADALGKDKKSTLTEAQAVRQILKEYKAKAEAPVVPSAPPAATPPVKPPAATPAPGTPMQTAAAQFAPQVTGDKSLNGIEANNMASMKPLNDAVSAAKAQLQAVAKSGDPVALQRYAKILADARGVVAKAAQEKFGNRAEQYLASIRD